MGKKQRERQRQADRKRDRERDGERGRARQREAEKVIARDKERIEEKKVKLRERQRETQTDRGRESVTRTWFNIWSDRHEMFRQSSHRFLLPSHCAELHPDIQEKFNEKKNILKI